MTELQLELWVPKGRKGGSWVTPEALPAGHDPSLYAKTWRKVLPGHKHKDKLAHSIAMRDRYSRDHATVCEQYCAWARNAGVSNVTIYSDNPHSGNAARTAGFYDSREVTRDDILGPPPAAEYDGDWDHDGAGYPAEGVAV